MPTVQKMEWAQIVGANIRRFRTARDMTQEQLAGDADVAMRHLGRIERGEGNPTVEVIGRLATILHVHPKDLFEVNLR